MKKKLLLTTCIFISLSGTLLAQWQQTNCNCNNSSVIGVNDTVIFEGTGGQNISRSLDGGANWTSVFTTAFGTAMAIRGTGTVLLAALAWDRSPGLVMKTRNNGNNWIQATGLSPTIDGFVTSFAFSGRNTYAGDYSNGVYLSTDIGSTWTAVNTNLTNLNVNALAASGINVFAGTNGGGVFLSSDTGGHWMAVNTNLTNLTINALAFSGTSLYAGTAGGGVFVSSDTGNTWTASNINLTNLSITSLVVNGTQIFAGTNSGVFLSMNNGANWTAINTGLASNNVSSLAISGTDIYGVFNGSGVWKRTLSDIITCVPTSSAVSPHACFSYTSPSGNYLWNVSNTYSDTLLNDAGCDSVITIHLTIDTVDVSVIQNSVTLTANAALATFQWVDCNGFTTLAGETDSAFTAATVGNYAVVITQNGCIDTTDCFNITGVGISDQNFEKNIRIIPNPSSGKFILECDLRLTNVKVEITDIVGRMVYKVIFDQPESVNIELNHPSGVYFLTVETANSKSTWKLIKE